MAANTATSVKLVEPKDATFELALEIATIFYDGFQKDPLTKLLFGPRYAIPTPPPSGTLGDYNKVLKFLAYGQWSRLIDPNTKTWVLYEGDRPVGFCTWFVPQDKNVALTLWQQIKSIYACALAFFWKNWYFRFRKNPPFSNPAFFDNFREAEEYVGYKELLVPEKELAHMSREELANARYSKKEYSWCQLVALRSDCHGKGYGEKMFKHSMENMVRYEPTFKDGQVKSKGPAKFALFATKPGRRLYEKLGWKAVDVFKKTMDDGFLMEYPLMVYTWND